MVRMIVSEKFCFLQQEMAKIAAELDEKKKKDEEKEAARKQVGYHLHSNIGIKSVEKIAAIVVVSSFCFKGLGRIV